MPITITPSPLKRGDTLKNVDGHLVGGIGGFCEACVDGQHLKQPLEVILVHGNHTDGFSARLGDAHHRVYQGKLTEAEVSFTLEAFQSNKGGNVLDLMHRDSQCLRFSVNSELRHFILNEAAKLGLRGALMHITGTANGIHVYGHTDTKHLNDQTKTFAHETERVGIEGWGNLSFIDGETPFVHVHGIYTAWGKTKGGHFIMDEKTHLHIDKASLTLFPIPSLIRTMQGEDFPTWNVARP